MYGDVGIFEDNGIAIGLAYSNDDWLTGKRVGDWSLCIVIGEWISTQLVVRDGRWIWN